MLVPLSSLPLTRLVDVGCCVQLLNIILVFQMLVSLLVFESTDLKATWTSYTENYEKLVSQETLPPALQLQPFGIELPGLGKVLAVGATWTAADQDNGREWISKIANLGNCLMNNPEPKSVKAYVEFNETLLTYGSYGRGYTLNIKRYTQKTAEVLAEYTASIPGGGIAMSLHMLRSPAPDIPSVFGSRVEHHMVELVAMTPVQDLEAQGADWACGLMQDLRESDPENVMESSYVALLGEDDSDYRKIYGSSYEELAALKKKYDPDNVFKYAVPRLSV